MRVAIIVLLSLSGCNVVPPLDCLIGVKRPGCDRDADGEYGYLYRSPVTPNGRYAVPVVTPATASPRTSQMTCFQTGTVTNCTTTETSR